MNEALMKGVTFDVRWVFHLIGCALLVLAIARPSKCVFFLIGAYCIFVPTRMLADEYVAGYGLWETASLLLRNIILTVPMYLAALLLIAEGSYYFKAKPGAPI